MDTIKKTYQNEKYWIHRISHEWDVSYKLLSEGYLSIGWSMLADSKVEKAVENHEKQRFETVMSKCGCQMTRSRWGLWRFLNFSINDFVVVPIFNGKFSIYRIKGIPMPITELACFAEFISENGSQIVRDDKGLLRRKKNNNVVDLGFVIKVEAIKESLSRYEYADSKLTARMKIRQTNADISDLSENIQNVISSNSPINFYAAVVGELADRLLNAIKVQLNPDKFELLIKWYFEKLGASRVIRPKKNKICKLDEADADVVAEFDAMKVIYCIQAKFHDGVTSCCAVKQISTYTDQQKQLVGEYTVIPWVISTANDYSTEAITIAQENNVHLVTGIEFGHMLIDAGIIDINKAFE